MDRNSARDYIREFAAQHLKRDKSGKGYICPLCGSGSGKNGTGMTTKDGIHFTCWAGCFTNADMVDIIGMEAGATGYTDKLQAACKVFGIDLDESSTSRTAQKPIQAAARSNQQQEQQPADYTDFFLQANKDLDKTDYHRGISGETLDRFHIGFVQAWRHPKAPNAPASPRLIIPTSNISYIARDTRADLTDEQKKYSKQKVGPVHIFNLSALQSANKPVFIVEGEIDALSVIDVSGAAVGLGSTANIPMLLKILEKQPKPKQPLIIALDSDPTGRDKANDLTAGLKELGISYYRPETDLYGEEVKDANGALMFDRDCFKRLIREVEQEAIAAAKEIQTEEQQEYAKNSAASYIQDFVNGIAASVNTPCIPTGFSNLDRVLDGGLYEGLYVIGAISSLGKTTFVLQAADQIAQAGQDVLIFSLEMARSELMAKSISRHTVQRCLANGESTRNAKTTRGITAGKKYANYSQRERELIKSSIQAYKDYADHIFIVEGMGNIGVDQVRQTVGKHISLTGNKPVVVIDYIQILAPFSDRATDKQNTDKAIMELKRISRDYKIPVIGISSFNRESYKEEVGMKAFKESGAIEYSSDVLLGLQLEGRREKGKNGQTEFDENAAKRKDPRDIGLVILKNRNGKTGDKLKFSYYAMFNYFEEA